MLLSLLLGFPPQTVTPQDPPPSLQYRLAAGAARPKEWLLLGAGTIDAVVDELVAKRISVMAVPWLTLPKGVLSSDVAPTDAKSLADFAGLAVDGSQLAQALSVVKNGASFRLVREHPRIWPPLGDAELLARFRSLRPLLSQLEAMAKLDRKLEYIDDSYFRPEGAYLSASRQSRYRTLLARSGVRGLDRTPKGCEMWTWGYGAAPISDFFKGYAYLPNPRKQVVANLDTVRFDPRRTFKAYRHIEGRWYLYFEFIP